MTRNAARSASSPWPLVRLDTLAEAPVLYGILQPGPQQPNGVPYVRPTEIQDDKIVLEELRRTTQAIAAQYRRSTLRADDILLSIVGTIGKVAVVPPELAGANITQSSVRIRVRPELVRPRFVAWALRSPQVRTQFDRVRLGTAVPRLNVRDVRGLEMPVPPLPQQDEIVEELEAQLSRLDNGLAALKRVQANLKRYRASVLKAACEGRLVPTEADLARREGRSYEPASVLLERIRAEKAKLAAANVAAPSRRGAQRREAAATLPTDLPPLPEGWAWAVVGELADALDYGTSARCSATDGEIPVLRMGNIEDGRLRLEALKFLPATHSEFPRLLLESGDLIFNRTNSPELVGKSAVYRGVPQRCSFASYLVRVRLGGACMPCLLAAYLNSPIGRAWIASVVSQQVGQANVSAGKLRTLVLPLPPLLEQRCIVAELERRLSLADALDRIVTANLHRTTRLRQSILATAFEGKPGRGVAQE